MKYIYMNDIEYLIKKRKKVLLLLLLVPVIVMLINVNSKMSSLEILNNCMGTSLNLKDGNVLEIIMFLFNVVIFLFLIVDLYIKDVAYQLDNIFLRIFPSKWFVKKSVVFIFLIFIIKFFQYFFLLALMFLITGKNINVELIIKLMLLDFLYIIFFQFLFIFTYVISLIFRKFRLIFYFFFLIIIILLPKNIYELNNNQIYILILLALLFLYLFYYLFKNYNKKIIESI